MGMGIEMAKVSNYLKRRGVCLSSKARQPAHKSLLSLRLF